MVGYIGYNMGWPWYGGMNMATLLPLLYSRLKHETKCRDRGELETVQFHFSKNFSPIYIFLLKCFV